MALFRGKGTKNGRKYDFSVESEVFNGLTKKQFKEHPFAKNAFKAYGLDEAFEEIQKLNKPTRKTEPKEEPKGE